MTKETKGDLPSFLIALAMDAEKHLAFQQDPEKAMDHAGLTEEQKELIRTATPYLAFAGKFLPGVLAGISEGQPKTIVVVIVVVVIIAP